MHGTKERGRPSDRPLANEFRTEQAQAAGRAGTILTGGQGVPLPQAPITRKTLLGQ